MRSSKKERNQNVIISDIAHKNAIFYLTLYAKTKNNINISWS